MSINTKNYDLSLIAKKPWIFLIIIGLGGILLRLYHFPFDIPVFGDAVAYFWYANDISILGKFPEGHVTQTLGTTPTNNGWPGILSIFFSLLNSNNFLDYINLQRLVTVSFSVLTIIPIYLLTKKFLEKPYAILCAAIFIFSPRIIENSLLGITEPLFILLLVSSVLLFLNDKKYLIFCSFAIVALSSLIRYEGLLILVPFTIIFFLRFKIKKITVLNYFIIIGIILIIISPMIAIRIDTTGNDGLVTHILSGPQYYVNQNTENDGIIFHFLEKGSFFLLKNLIYVSIPMFFIFIPYGIFELFRNRNHEKITLISFGVAFLFPAFYAASRGFEETRYLFILYPIFCLMAGYTIRKIDRKINRTNLLFYATLACVIICSVISTDFMINDYYDNDKEFYLIAKDIHQLTTTVNRDYEGLMFLMWTDDEINERFPLLYSELGKDLNTHTNIVSLGKNTKNNFENLNDYLEYSKTQKMTHLILNGYNLDTKFLQEIFNNEKDYPYLNKIYDSSELGFTNHVKIFQIDYEKFSDSKK